MGLPEIYIHFQTAAVTAVNRSARGTVLLVLKDSTAAGTAVYTALTDVDKSAYTSENYCRIRLAFLSCPSRVIVVCAGEDETSPWAEVRRLDYNWLCAPEFSAEEVVSFVKARRAAGQYVKAVTAGEGADCEGIVQLAASELKLSMDGAAVEVSAADYACRIAGILAGLSLARSATYYSLSEVVSCGGYEDEEAAVDSGKLILLHGTGGWQLGRGVTSLVTLTGEMGASFQKIKVVEGVDLIRTDIADTFRNGYVGQVLNDYDTKLMLVSAINAYFKSLKGTVLDKSSAQEASLSLTGQRTYLESQGVDTTELTDLEILKANTGSRVFLSAALTFCDAMEDLSFEISM